ncbi:TRAP-type C4-dicarboxylate transport system, small permease component [Modicisalibacter ilicicola DSM 19980]|uniref:TRAP transporter small permease protein n=1 Tax=Modicisalibacter ilicicola DSM 19980 TaxID=1121942 RepID=A0A1M5F2F9_9GAMM|nr:TRAP transporter small permease [Halomonas ilicicola]SHF85743.1 TRAP-type C4-dicarboxylate transport system, small permease component [Halomonas ilicicola DSM 19980]
MNATSTSHLSYTLGLLKRSLEIIVGLLVLGVVFCVVANVFGRFVLNYSYVWAEELSRVLFIWLVLLGAGLGSLNNEHVSVTFFKNLAPTPLRKAFGILSALAIYVVCICILVGFQELMSGYISVTPLLKISKTLLYSAMPVMAVLTLIANTIFLFELLKRGRP